MSGRVHAFLRSVQIKVNFQYTRQLQVQNDVVVPIDGIDPIFSFVLPQAQGYVKGAH
jgi:hypothetical protein